LAFASIFRGNRYDVTIGEASVLYIYMYMDKIVATLDSKSSPVTGLEWPREFQEVEVPTFLDNGTGWW
jgi:hypothetical protein